MKVLKINFNFKMNSIIRKIEAHFKLVKVLSQTPYKGKPTLSKHATDKLAKIAWKKL